MAGLLDDIIRRSLSDRLMNESLLPAEPRGYLPTGPLASRTPMTDVLMPDHGMSMLDRFKSVGTLEGGANLAANLIGGPGLRGVAPALRQAQRYLKEPARAAYPGIYKRPDVIASEAAANVAPEHPALKQLFGVTRDDLWELGGRGTRAGNAEPSIATRANPRGSYAADAIMTPKNADRLVQALGEAEKYPQLTRGMDSWYVMDPAYQRMSALVGPDRAKDMYRQFNTVTSMFSPGSDVLTEINRGTAANMMLTQGKFDDFARYGGTASANRGADFPAALRDVQGHPYHSTAHTGPLGRYLEAGVVDMTQPKVPLYMQASGVPETGFQTRLPVPDAHFTRAVGMSDVRKNANPGASMKTPEYAGFGPWYRENVAAPVGLEAVPAQARMWGLYAPQTGVDTPVGAPKLELLAQAISERAAKLGVDPATLRDNVLTGKAHASWLLGGLIPAGMAATGMADRWDEDGRL